VKTFTIGKKPASIQQTYSVTNFIIRNVGNIRGCERGVCSHNTLIAQIFLYFPIQMICENSHDWQETRINPAKLQSEKNHNWE